MSHPNESDPHESEPYESPPHVHGPGCHHDHPIIPSYRRSEPKLGRNDPCSCGSGKKYKKCHGGAG